MYLHIIIGFPSEVNGAKNLDRDGLHVVDVRDADMGSVGARFSYDHSQACDRTRRGGKPNRSPFEVWGTAPIVASLRGWLALVGRAHD